MELHGQTLARLNPFHDFLSKRAATAFDPTNSNPNLHMLCTCNGTIAKTANDVTMKLCACRAAIRTRRWTRHLHVNTAHPVLDIHADTDGSGELTLQAKSVIRIHIGCPGVLMVRCRFSKQSLFGQVSDSTNNFIRREGVGSNLRHGGWIRTECPGVLMVRCRFSKQSLFGQISDSTKNFFRREGVGSNLRHGGFSPWVFCKLNLRETSPFLQMPLEQGKNLSLVVIA